MGASGVPSWFRLASRVRGLAVPLALLAIAASALGARLLPAGYGGVTSAVTVVGFVLLLAGLLLAFQPGAPRSPARPVAAPVAGRWLALNSPASRVPSHGIHSFGQTFAIDLVFEPEDGSRPAFGQRAFRPATDYPGFGQPVYAPAAGHIVRVHQRARDHRSRSSWPAVAYLLLSGAFRELGGPRTLLGNHVVIALDGGGYAALAHLRRGSVVVRPGQRVAPGDLLGECGNSGNTSEPHLHFQLMDHRWPVIAAGLPFEFTSVVIDDGGPGSGVPANQQVMVAGQPPS